ncbi:peptidyl-tRNA hydrolase PTH2-domain-containing protein [Tribonema minus]|uniref:peptidyl-tRNA hydrolase n=1 Tax=Tribonema minus TaxID=303371 RepID=A0A836C8I9_9STRA|nr:peptidyl-tRNA hydrolase PTH2-domain-containing protein [Tribonema minus]
MTLPAVMPTAALLVASFFTGVLSYAWFGPRQHSSSSQTQPQLSAPSRRLAPGQPLAIREEVDSSDSEEEAGSVDQIRDWTIDDGPFKLVLVVNSELKMGKGKVAAQCCHATLGCYKTARRHAPNCVKSWEYLAQAKICVKCPEESEMWQIREKAEAAGLVTYMVADAGRTQIPSGSRTVLGIGPAPETAFLGITDHLKLM